MTKYRARSCPKCSYFVGFALAPFAPKTGASALMSFCLNCNYKLPVLSMVRGRRRSSAFMRRGSLRLAHAVPADLQRDCRHNDVESKITPADYSRHLRAIGQDLEALRFSQFNLEFTGDAYLVWIKSDNGDSPQPVLRINKNRLQKLWRDRTPPRRLGHQEFFPIGSGRRLRYSVQELDRIEREHRAQRRRESGHADGHSLSQLLRTVGDFLEQRRDRLLGIAWQELSVSVVLETTEGRKEIEVFRPDNLYDLWVRMYLKRQNRASLDTPR
jgi:hypothetical protein